jgi:hypothetical protein
MFEYFHIGLCSGNELIIAISTMTKRIFPIDHYFSPLFILRRFQTLLERCGNDIVLHSTRFQKEREAWITALFLMGWGNYSKQMFWVGIEEDARTPDTYGVTFHKLDKGLSRDIASVEILEWEGHAQLGLAEHIGAKLTRKHYPQHFILLCYAHGRTGESVNLEEVFREVTERHYPLTEIWLLSSQMHPMFDHKLTKLHPNRFGLDFKFEDELLRLPVQPDILKASFGIGEKLEYLGSMAIEPPDCGKSSES